MSDTDDDTPGPERIINVIGGAASNINKMIGSGIYAASGIVWKEAGSPGLALVLWLVGGIVSLFGSLTYVELGSTFPESGGETVYLKEAFPRPRALLSYMFTFCMILVIFPGVIAADSNVVAQYLIYVATENSTKPGDPENLHPNTYFSGFDFWRLRGSTLLVLWTITMYHALSNKWAHNINQALTAIKAVTLLAVSIVGLANMKETGNWSRLFDGSNFSSLPNAMLPILYAYEGWNNLNYTLDEFRNPREKLKFSNIASVAIVTFLYLLVNIAYIGVVQFNSADQKEILAGQFAFAIADLKWGKALSFFIAVSSFGATASTVFAGARIVSTAARKKYLPGASYIECKYGDRSGTTGEGAEDERNLQNEGTRSESTPSRLWDSLFNTPWKALVLQGIYCSIIIVFYPSDDPFMFLVSASEYCAWVFYGITAIGLLWMAYNGERREYFKIPLVFPSVFALFAFFIIVGSFFFAPQEPLSYPYWIPFVISFIIIALGGVLWKLLGIGSKTNGNTSNEPEEHD